MRTRLKLAPDRVWNEIREQGNTSSSTIPLALDTVLRRPGPAARIGLCAFGGGFTWAGAILAKPAVLRSAAGTDTRSTPAAATTSD